MSKAAARSLLLATACAPPVLVPFSPAAAQRPSAGEAKAIAYGDRAALLICRLTREQ